jgi:hypothetical protein
MATGAPRQTRTRLISCGSTPSPGDPCSPSTGSGSLRNDWRAHECSIQRSPAGGSGEGLVTWQRHQLVPPSCFLQRRDGSVCPLRGVVPSHHSATCAICQQACRRPPVRAEHRVNTSSSTAKRNWTPGAQPGDGWMHLPSFHRCILQILGHAYPHEMEQTMRT